MISEHFSERELACRHCGRVKVSCELMAALEELRRRKGRPLPIISGYRCPRHNRAVGGARRSQHVRGQAADIPALYATAEEAWACGFTGIGTTKGWATHVDVRAGERTWWSYDS